MTDFSSLPTMYSELCQGGCGRYRPVVYRLDIEYPPGSGITHTTWCCMGCHIKVTSQGGAP